MNLLDRLLFRILKGKFSSWIIVRLALRLHNYAYKLTGAYSINLEPDKIHPKHRLIKYHDWFVSKVNKAWNLVDVGCGNGALAFSLKDHCASILAIDSSKKILEIARAKFFDEKIHYVFADATKYHYDRKYDAIVLSNVLEHISDRVAFLKRLFSVAEIGETAVLLLRVPMINRDWITLYKKELDVEWRLDPTHFIEYTYESLAEELSQAGLKIIEHVVQYGEIYVVAISDNSKDNHE